MVLCFMAGVTGLVLWRVVSTSESAQESNKTWSPTTLKSPIQVQVVGHDFVWRFRFPGPDAKFDTKDDASVEKELHLPVERDIVFLVTSDDYVYTMTIPDLGLRQIAVPGLTYPLEFRVTEECSIDIIADPLCGVRIFHDEYMGNVIVQSKTAFDSWYKEIQ